MMRRSLAAAVLTLALLPAASAPARTLSSTPYGAVDFGDRIAYRVDGADCERALPRVVVTAAGHTVSGPASRPRVDGVDPSGCTGAATVPSFRAVRAAGWRQGDAIAIALRDGAGSVPLRYFRIEADQGKAAAGAPVVGPAGDQDTASNDKAVTLSAGDAVSLGRVDLRRVDTLALRLCITGTEGPTHYVEPLGPAGAVGANERGEPPVYLTIHQNSPTGPALIGSIDVSSNPTTGPRLATEGSGGCYRLLSLPVTGRTVSNAPELFVGVDAAPPGVLQLNSVDVNGTAAKIPAPRESDPAGMRALFDGTSFKGWDESNCLLRDGAASNLRTGSATEISGCTMTYGKKLHDVVLRFDVRRRNFFDNGLIGVPSEIQLRSVGEYLPGGYFGEYQARAQKLNAWPDWSHIQIAQLGGRYVVTINGRTVTDHVASAGDPGPFDFKLQAQPEWSYRFGASNGFGHEGSPDVEKPSEWGDFWFRDVRVLECASKTDARCLALANANPGQAPQK